MRHAGVRKMPQVLFNPHASHFRRFSRMNRSAMCTLLFAGFVALLGACAPPPPPPPPPAPPPMAMAPAPAPAPEVPYVAPPRYHHYARCSHRCHYVHHHYHHHYHHVKHYAPAAAPPPAAK